jgi:hypothetical protein
LPAKACPRAIQALEAAAGQVLWKQKVAYAPRRDDGGRKGGGQAGHPVHGQFDYLRLGRHGPGGLGTRVRPLAAVNLGITCGISSILAWQREKLPGTRVRLPGIFPKERAPGARERRKIQAVNSLIAPLNDEQRIRFLVHRFIKMYTH